MGQTLTQTPKQEQTPDSSLPPASAAPSAGALPAAPPMEEAPALAPAVARARVLSRVVNKGGGERGGNLIIERIAPPVLTLREQAEADAAAKADAEKAEAAAAQAANPPGVEWRAAIRAAAPLSMQLFTPRVTILHQPGDNGGSPSTLSLVQWWSWTSEPQRGYENYAAWVNADLSAIDACPDLNSKARTRYLLMPTVMSASPAGKHAPPLQPPSLPEFAGPQSFLLEKGDAGHAAALEPLHLLLEAFARDGEKIARDHAVLKAHQEASAAAAAFEAAHPKPAADTVLRFWTSDADEIEPAGIVR